MHLHSQFVRYLVRAQAEAHHLAVLPTFLVAHPVQFTVASFLIRPHDSGGNVAFLI